MIYQGDRVLDMYRNLDSIPVLAKAGAILPVTDEISGVQAIKNPDSLRIKVFAGADGEFELYEDDNETCNYEKNEYVITKMTFEKSGVFTIFPANGKLALIPEKRSYIVELTGYQKSAVDTVKVEIDGKIVDVAVTYDKKKQAVEITISECDVTKEVKIFISEAALTYGNQIVERSFNFLNQAEIEFSLKERIYSLVTSGKSIPVKLAELKALEID